MEQAAVVLYPSPPIGHLTPMVELGKLILQHYPSFSIHILITTPPYKASSTAPYIASISSTIPSIVFHYLPTITIPPELVASAPNHEDLTFEILRLNNPNVHQALLSISKTFSVRAFIMDFFCYQGFSVTSKLNIPSYFFMTSGASMIAYYLCMPTLHQTISESYKDLDILLDIPGMPPIPSLDLPKVLLDRHSKAYENFLHFSMRLSEIDGVFINTFESLEARVIKAMTDGLCVSDGRTPPVYPIGPLIVDSSHGGGRVSRSNSGGECLRWLDQQPSKSVVFLCFGSLGLFSKDQLKEIATGLEKSGQRFLWVVRNPPPENLQNLGASPDEDPDISSLLTEGFLDRTKDRGLVLKSWAPQVQVLNHQAVGGFVTHCGWNSVLEAVCAGVPMIAWPLYAEQKFNRVILVEEIKIALWMHENKSGVVSAAEVEARVVELMESEKGEVMREQVKIAHDAAKAALAEGGSSRVSLDKVVGLWKQMKK